jgi:hypothetical protein
MARSDKHRSKHLTIVSLSYLITYRRILMFKHLLLIATLILSSISAQADTLVISGSFKSAVSAKGIKTVKSQDADSFYLYEDGTFDNYDGETYGTYTRNGNGYVLYIDPESADDSLGDDTYLDDYSSLQFNVKFNKKGSKAKVIMNATLWISNEDGEQVKVKLNTKCNCSVQTTLD